MSNPLHINAGRLLGDIADLARIGASDSGGVHRPALSPTDIEARAWFRERVRTGGFRPGEDGAGNLSAVLPAADPSARTLLLGSHLDTVPDGGRFDGALGVLAALEVLRTIREAGLILPVRLEAIAFTDEEGTHISLLGSKAAAGLLAEADLEHPHSSREAFAAGLARAGLTPEGLLSARRDPASLAGYLELHIEQGARLEQSGTDIGVVTAIVGIRSFWLTFTGEAAHAGTMPLPDRRDALWGAAAFIGRARAAVLADFMPGTMNCGIISVTPGAFNIAPGQARLALEFRHPDTAVLEEMEAALLALAGAAAEEHGLQLAVTPVGSVAATPLAADMIAAIERAADRLGRSHMRLASFAGHDAMSMQAITPSGMLFVPSVGGISHNPGEATPDADIVSGANVLLHTVLDLAGAADRGS